MKETDGNEMENITKFKEKEAFFCNKLHFN